jgi:hypothetical protein
MYIQVCQTFFYTSGGGKTGIKFDLCLIWETLAKAAGFHFANNLRCFVYAA